MKKSLLFVIALCSFSVVFAQQKITRCVERELLLEKEKQHPGYLNQVDAVFNQAKQYANAARHQRSVGDTIYHIRLVFHVLYTTPSEDVPDSVILNQVAILNRDYRRRNEDTVKTRDIFKDRAVDAHIEFYLATTDPQGNPTSGIVHTVGNPSGFLGYSAFSDNMKTTSTGGEDPWPTDKYLNIWVCNISQFTGVLGYAFPPDNAPNWQSGSFTDSTKQGVVLDSKVVGSNFSAPIDATVAGGRSAVHEIGHYLGLRHIWGDGDCTMDDGLDDTPDADAAHQQTCDTTQNTCVGTPVDEPDMIENYMDYSDDRCLNMFTREQVGIMRAMLATSRAGIADIEVVAPNAIKDEAADAVSFELFPNPAKGIFTVRSNMPGKLNYVITNSLGETVLSSSSSSVDLSNQSSGIYFVKMQAGDKTTVKRLELMNR